MSATPTVPVERPCSPCSSESVCATPMVPVECEGVGADTLLSAEVVIPGWRRSQIGMTLVVFVAFFGFNFVMPILPLYVQALGVSDVSQAALVSGLMLAISPLMASIFSPLWGLVADRFGRKVMVARAMLIIATACVLMGLATTIWQLFVLRATIGIFGGFTAMTMAYIVTVAPPSRAGQALGMLQASQVGGVIVGPLCAGLVADHFGLRAAFFSGAVVVLIGFLLLNVLTEDDRKLLAATRPVSVGATDGKAVAPQRGGLAALREAAQLPGLVSIMLILFLAQVVDRSFGPILPLYVTALGTPADQVASYAGLAVSLGAVGTAVSAAVVGQFSGRLPVRPVLLASLLAGVGLCLPIAVVRSPVELLLTRTLLGLFAGGSITLAYTLANDAVPPARKGAAFGVLSSTALLGSATSPLAMGGVASLQLRAVFWVDAGLYALALGWAWWSGRQRSVAPAATEAAAVSPVVALQS